MTRNLLKITLFFLLFSSLGGCKEDIGVIREQNTEDSELLVDFIISQNEYTSSRTVFNDYGTELFSDGDMIHIVGTFNLSYSVAPDEENKLKKVESRYGALKYNGKSWNPVEGSELAWPAVATDGEFTAYFISGSSSILTDTVPSDLYLLSEIVPGTDPLIAVSAKEIPYGNAVALNFTHICAYLTLTDMIPIVADEFWFTTKNRKDPDTDEALPFNNAFQIALKDGTHGPELDFRFLQSPDPNYKDSVFIASQKQIKDENGSTTASAGYFLQPGFYPDFKIVYPASDTDVYDFLEYDYNKILQNPGNSDQTVTKPDLQPNTPYFLSITKAPGVTIRIPPSDDQWDESGNYYDILDVEAFLKAIYEGKEYSEENVEILQKTATGTLLLRNLNFNNFNYEDFQDKSFRPNNQDGSVFDGGYHYIKNLASPLFRYNYGTIQNLGIQTVNIVITSYETDDASDDDTSLTDDNDMSRVGAFCKWNRTTAKINNIRVSDVNLTVNVMSLDPKGQETHNIGGIIGSNTGKVTEVAVSGNFNITVKGDNNNEVNASVLIGGIVGQNAGLGEIRDVSPITEGTGFIITNTCQGPLGAYSLGGAAGESTGYISNVSITNLRIDSSSSKGLTSYIGGLAGQLQVSLNDTSGVDAVLESCNVGGSVKAGESAPSGSLTSVSYIGGIAGTVMNVPITDCNSSVAVYGATTSVNNVIYGTGGAIGRIREGEKFDFEDIIAYGYYLTYPKGDLSYYGNFAGIAPDTQTPADYANKDIHVYEFTDVSFIGGFLAPVLSK